jgi:hypothetical protein
VERVEAAVALEAFYGRVLLVGCVGDRDLAAADWLAVEEDGVGATLAFAAAVLRTYEDEGISEDADEGRSRISVDAMTSPVDDKGDAM